LEKINEVFTKMRNAHERFPGHMGHIMGVNPVIEVDKSGKTAECLWYAFGPLSMPGLEDDEL